MRSEPPRSKVLSLSGVKFLAEDRKGEEEVP
jgi:hypothetical protein